MFVEIAGHLMVIGFCNDGSQIEIMSKFLNNGVFGGFGFKPLEAVIVSRVDHRIPFCLFLSLSLLWSYELNYK